MAYRTTERDRDRDRYEHPRFDRFSDARERLESADDDGPHVYTRRSGRGRRDDEPPLSATARLPPPPPWERLAEREVREGFRERDESAVGPAPPIMERDRERERRYRGVDEEVELEGGDGRGGVVLRERERSRERRRVVYDDSDEGSLPPRLRRPVSPPEVARSRRVVRSPSPGFGGRPPMLVRRQSSLDTFDRKPAGKRYWERERGEEYGPPARRSEQRVPHYVDIPLPRTKALPPPRGKQLTPLGELELVTARSSAGDIIEERIERRTEIYESSPAPPPPMAAQVIHGGSGPLIVDAHPPHHHHHPPVDVVKTTVVRDVSPARYTTSSYDTYDTTSSYDTYTSSAPTIVLDSRSREVSGHVPVGPVALAGDRHHRHHRHESDDLRSEIRHLEKELARRESRSRHRHSHSRHRSMSRGDLVRAERLGTGELVLYEEEIEPDPRNPPVLGPRLERDKRGRMSISVPRYR
ncbi:predicted protein [Chaetomium globosum CBS 148.51]|uniref:Uncharacterized protein n=1 Tax=Chaetomium globosum (strain ATCC 6205 / CBS 148.51 / DSM 1962 / NBRC 6347 / NRRL 1970) TaxID=306901 RepID=Q2GT73_CHAGB|nr:uncharacterized protein CHGG_08831 [Chaetomium globosum CBS 148.51]EAQ84817.1 predicted protein [Chaetomium globosum CBS 148.51]